jgi:glycerophosphoryl diester phosphodiesterase
MTALAQTHLPRAHAHNDYEHTRPLLDALEQGFGSVEADVYPIDGELLVAHDFKNVKKDRTLERLYLAPLKKHFETNKEPMILLVDIKTNGVLAYQTLEKQLEKYHSILTEFSGDKIKTNLLTVILSGDRPIEYLQKQTQRWAAIDGRLPDLAQNPPRSLIPLVSDNWANHFKWQGGDLSQEEAKKLDDLVTKAHAQGRMIRFWGARDIPEVWRLHLESGVDLINTDHLTELAAFLNKARPPAK